MRIAYGVFGYGRGHATRALGVLPELCGRHEVLIFAGGDAFDALSPSYPVRRIPILKFVYRGRGKRSNFRTLGENWDAVRDLLIGGEGVRSVQAALREFRPEVAICDAEPWTHQAAARLGIPRISFDHFGILAYCRPNIGFGDRLRSERDVAIYRTLMGRPARMIVSSFYSAPPSHRGVRCVGPLLRDEVRALSPTRGEHLTVYLNNGDHQLTPRIEEALRATGLPMRIYGTRRTGADGLLEFLPPSNEGFLRDLASCRAVISTAGNQLVGEAMFLGKPLLVKPEDSVEQRLNAAAIERLGIGMQTRHRNFSLEVIRRFLQSEASLRDRTLALARDGRAEALAALEGFARELQSRRQTPVRRAWRYA